ncbi:hypothetical protein BCEN4_740062 [Burkholderia cenocepacia]|uniref:hypothetical protein n=1 Tax=Burkholderia cenocepacia TaxID=95486 RepID=UPI00192A8E44|nr:hypothetical protein [Burkholderia cenocepacia]CAD9227928.1 hypothetical protein BCEN4_740062 [Burkholderia cenocepacia]
MRLKNIVLTITLVIIASSSFAKSFPYIFPIKQTFLANDPWIVGKIHELKVVDNGTDLVIGFNGEDWKVHVPTKLDSKIWRHNQSVYLDKNDGHLHLWANAPHLD